MAYQLTDHDIAYHAQHGRYPLRTQMLLHCEETGESQAASFVAILTAEVLDRQEKHRG